MIIRKADLRDLIEGTKFEIIEDGTICTLEIVNGKYQINMGVEIIALEEEFNKNVDIKILNNEEYYYNKKDVEILQADLFKLKDGTKFLVLNGAWEGYKRIEGDRHFITHERGLLNISKENNGSLDIVILSKEEKSLRRMAF